MKIHYKPPYLKRYNQSKNNEICKHCKKGLLERIDSCSCIQGKSLRITCDYCCYFDKYKFFMPKDEKIINKIKYLIYI